MAKRNAAKKQDDKNVWVFPTNHQNMLFMLGSGLISGPDGFKYDGKSKYYKDALSLYPGWIPLYKDSVPDEVRSLSTSETANIVSTTASINLDHYFGNVYVISNTGETKQGRYSDIADACTHILVPAPLPVAWICEIAFETESDRVAFESASANYGNADIAGMNITVLPSIESAPTLLQGFVKEPVEFDGIADIKTTEREQALGGILAMLYRLANKSDLCLESFKKARDVMATKQQTEYGLSSIDDPIISYLPEWLAETPIGKKDANGLAASFFYGLLDDIIIKRDACSTGVLTAVAREYVINKIDAFKFSSDQNEQMLSNSLIALMNEIDSDRATLSEMFNKHNKTLRHALLLFFLREQSIELFEFQSQNPSIAVSDADYIAAALLFGARDGWVGLPSGIRRDLTPWITSLMAERVHSVKGIIQLPSEPTPLREFFTGSAWDENMKYAYKIAQRSKWEDCMRTRIKVGNSFTVENGYLILEGDVKGSAIKSDIDQSKFLKKLGICPIDEKTEQTTRVEIRGIAK